MPCSFTKEDVVNAYVNLKEKGVKPIFGSFYGANNGKVCSACALTAVILDKQIEGLSVENLCAKISDEDSKSYQDMVGMSTTEMWAFIDGFDTPDGESCNVELYNEVDLAAYRLGRECRIGVLERFPELVG